MKEDEENEEAEVWYFEVELEELECCRCGILFAAPQGYVNRLRNSGVTFYCPNGHGLIFRRQETPKLVQTPPNNLIDINSKKKTLWQKIANKVKK